MTLMEFFGCGLVAFSPVLVMFVFTVAKDPLKIIILTCSSFFWLLSLLLSAVVWYAIVPLRDHLVFGMIMSVIFQEAIRLALYYLLKKAESGLQKIALAEEEPSTTDTAVAGADNDSAATAATSAVNPNASIDAAGPIGIVQTAMLTSSGRSQRADRVNLTDEARSSSTGRILDLTTLSYVCGLGFGFMSGAFAMVNLLADLSGPGSVGLAGEHEAFLLVSASLALLFSCLNISWTVLTFACLESRKFYLMGAVWASHMLCSLLTLLNSRSNPTLSLAPILTSLACLVGCLLLSLTMIGLRIPSFLMSLLSPRWMSQVVKIVRTIR